MAGIHRASNPNIPSHLLEQAVETARNAEYAGTPFTDNTGDGTYDPADPNHGPNVYKGCNRAGSCAPGIGVNSGDYDPELRNWDGPPNRQARVNQASTHIGSGDPGQPATGNGPGYASSGITTDPMRTAGNVASTWDFNDEFGFQQSPAGTAPDAVIANGVVNRTGLTIPANSWAWGTHTQAGVTSRAFVIEGVGTNSSAPARIGLEGNWGPGQRIRVEYDVDGGAQRVVAFDVLTSLDALGAANGLANEFVVDPDVIAQGLSLPVIHTALHAPSGVLNIQSVQVINT